MAKDNNNIINMNTIRTKHITKGMQEHVYEAIDILNDKKNKSTNQIKTQKITKKINDVLATQSFVKGIGHPVYGMRDGLIFSPEKTKTYGEETLTNMYELNKTKGEEIAKAIAFGPRNTSVSGPIFNLDYNDGASSTALQQANAWSRINKTGRTLIYDTETLPLNSPYGLPENGILTEYASGMANVTGLDTDNPSLSFGKKGPQSTILGINQEQYNRIAPIAQKFKDGKPLTRTEQALMDRLALTNKATIEMEKNGYHQYTSFPSIHDVKGYTYDDVMGGLNKLKTLGDDQFKDLVNVNGVKMPKVFARIYHDMNNVRTSNTVLTTYNGINFDSNIMMTLSQDVRLSPDARKLFATEASYYANTNNNLDIYDVSRNNIKNPKEFYKNIFFKGDEKLFNEFEKRLSDEGVTFRQQEAFKIANELKNGVVSGNAAHLAFDDIQTLGNMFISPVTHNARINALKHHTTISKPVISVNDTFVINNAIGIKSSRVGYATKDAISGEVGIRGMRIDTTNGNKVRQSSFDTFGLKGRAAYTVTGIDQMNDDEIRTVQHAMPGIKGQKMYRVALQATGVKQGSAGNTHYLFGTADELTKTFGKHASFVGVYDGTRLDTSGVSSETMRSLGYTRQSGMVVDATADSILAETQRAYLGSSARKFRNYELKDAIRLQWHVADLRKRAIKNLGTGASEDAIFKEVMRIDNKMFEEAMGPNFRKSQYVKHFGFKFNGDTDAYTTTMDSYHHLVEQAYKTRDSQSYMIGKLKETIKDFDGKTMSSEGYKKAAVQYKTWMETLINGTPNKAGIGVSGIGLRNGETHSRAHFSMTGWGNAVDGAELTVGTNGVNLTSKMSAIDPTLKSLDDPRQALYYGKGVIKHLHKTGQISDINWMDGVTSIEKLNEGFSQYVKDNIDNNPSWMKNTSTDMNVHNIDAFYGYESLDDVKNVISIVGSQKPFTMKDINGNNEKFSKALNRIVEQSVDVNEDHLQDSGKKIFNGLRDRHKTAVKNFAERNIKSAIRNGREVIIGENAILIDGQKLPLGVLTSDLHGGLYTSINGTRYATPLKYSVIESWDKNAKEMVPQKLDLVTDYIQGIESVGEKLTDKIYSSDNDNPISSALSYSKKYMKTDSIATLGTAREATDSLSVSVFETMPENLALIYKDDDSHEKLSIEELNDPNTPSKKKYSHLIATMKEAYEKGQTVSSNDAKVIAETEEFWKKDFAAHAKDANQDLVDAYNNSEFHGKSVKHGLAGTMDTTFAPFGGVGTGARGIERQIEEGLYFDKSDVARAKKYNPDLTIVADNFITTEAQLRAFKNIKAETGQDLVDTIGGHNYDISTDTVSAITNQYLEANPDTHEFVKDMMSSISTYDGQSVIMPEALDAGMDQGSRIKRINTARLSTTDEATKKLFAMQGLAPQISFENGRIIYKQGEGTLLSPGDGIVLKGYSGETIHEVAEYNLATISYLQNGRKVKQAKIQAILQQYKDNFDLPDSSPIKKSIGDIMRLEGFEERLEITPITSRNILKINTGDGEKGASRAFQAGMGQIDSRMGIFLDEVNLSRLKGESFSFTLARNANRNGLWKSIIKAANPNANIDELINNAFQKSGFSSLQEVTQAAMDERMLPSKKLRSAFSLVGLSDDFLILSNGRAGRAKHMEAGINIAERMSANLHHMGVSPENIKRHLDKYFEGTVVDGSKVLTDHVKLIDPDNLEKLANRLERMTTQKVEINGEIHHVQRDYRRLRQERMSVDSTIHKDIMLDHNIFNKSAIKNFSEEDLLGVKKALGETNAALLPETNTKDIFDARRKHFNDTLTYTAGETAVMDKGNFLWNDRIENEFREKYNLSKDQVEKITNKIKDAGFEHITADKVAQSHQFNTNNIATSISAGELSDEEVKRFADTQGIGVTSLEDYSKLSEGEKKQFLSGSGPKVIDLGEEIGSLKSRAKDAEGSGRYLALGYRIPGNEDKYGNELMSDAEHKIKTALNAASEYGLNPDVTEENLSEKLDDATIAIGNQVTTKNGFMHQLESANTKGMIATAIEERRIINSDKHFIGDFKVSELTKSKVRPGIIGISEKDARAIYGQELENILGKDAKGAVDEMITSMKTHGVATNAIRYPAQRPDSFSNAYTFIDDTLKSGELSIDKVTMGAMGGDYDTDQIANSVKKSIATVTYNGKTQRIAISQAVYEQLNKMDNTSAVMDDEDIWNKHQVESMLEGKDRAHFHDKTIEDIREEVNYGSKGKKFMKTDDTRMASIAAGVGGLDAGKFDVMAGRDLVDQLQYTQFAQENKKFAYALTAIRNIPETATLTPKSGTGTAFDYSVQETFTNFSSQINDVLNAKNQKETEKAAKALYATTLSIFSDDTMRGKVFKETMGSELFGEGEDHIHNIAKTLVGGLMHIQSTGINYGVGRTTDEVAQRTRYKVEGGVAKSDELYAEQSPSGRLRDASSTFDEIQTEDTKYTKANIRYKARSVNANAVNAYVNNLEKEHRGILGPIESMNLMNSNTQDEAQAKMELGAESKAVSDNKAAVARIQKAGAENRAGQAITQQQDDAQELGQKVFDDVAGKAKRILMDEKPKLPTGGSFSKIALGAAAGIMLSGYNSNIIKRMPAPATDQAQDARTAEQGYSASQIPQLSDTSLPILQQAPRKGYIININANTPGGQDMAQQLIPAAISNSMNGGKNVNINTSFNRNDNRMTNSQLNSMVNQALSSF